MKHAERAHALISPSALSRIIACPGSVALCEGLPEVRSEAADTGTKAHELLEGYLNGRQRAPRGSDPAMVKVIRPIVDWVTKLAADRKLEIIPEMPVPAGEMLYPDNPEVCWGTADVVLHNEKELIVLDLKYGVTPVAAKDNPQLLAYALGALTAIGDTGQKITVGILQPRTAGPMHEFWEPEDEEVEEFLDAASNAIELALQALEGVATPALIPGDEQCRWCRAAATCPALKKKALEPFEDLTKNKVEESDEATLADILSRKKLLLALLDAVETQALERALSGSKIPGFKLVESVTRRTWVDYGALLDELEACQLPMDKLAPPTLVSPAQAEKLVPKAQQAVLSRFITKPKGKPTLAPESDKRPPLGISDFEAIN